MSDTNNLGLFLNPASVAVIGASNTLGAWGNMIMYGLLMGKYQGKIYPVNPKSDKVLNIPAYASLLEVPDEVDLAVVAVPAEHIAGVLRECAAKDVKGVLMITAGFAEAVDDGRELEAEMASFAAKNGMRIIGPNVSGIFDQSTNFFACPGVHLPLSTSAITIICQGGFAIYDLMRKGHTEHQGVGKFIHTGNEADLKLTDFLEYIGEDESTEVILLHIEGIRDGRRFLEVGKKVARKKPIIAFKAGTTLEGNRAAASHTGALAGSGAVYSSLFKQTGIIEAPNFETLLEIGYAFLRMPPIKGNRVCMVTMGGSWGVMFTDSFIRHGLTVPEPSKKLQKALRDLGFPIRASTRNPIDVGAAGASLDDRVRSELVRLLITSGEFDALVIHGLCMAGFVTEKSPPAHARMVRANEALIKEATELGNERGVAVVTASLINGQESQIYRDLTREGINIYNRTDDVGFILSALHGYHSRRRR